MKFCWTTINVSDMEKSLAFYRDIIGLTINRRMSPNSDMELAFLGDGDTQLELICNKKNTDISHGKDISLGFVVDSTEKFTAFLQSKEIALHSGPFQPNPNIRFVYALDPDGLKIQFVENIAQ
ncbi:MAG: VOC family protein [Spirochaetales bacterium]|nr:VOC family protein [Spirochaetales bacterium]